MGPLLSIAIGLALGFLSIWLGDLGQIIMVLLLALLVAYHVRNGQLFNASALAIGAGGVVSLLLGSIILETVTDPAIQTEAPTYLAFTVGLAVAVFGLALGVFALVRRT